MEYVFLQLSSAHVLLEKLPSSVVDQSTSSQLSIYSLESSSGPSYQESTSQYSSLSYESHTSDGSIDSSWRISSEAVPEITLDNDDDGAEDDEAYGSCSATTTTKSIIATTSSYFQSSSSSSSPGMQTTSSSIIKTSSALKTSTIAKSRPISSCRRQGLSRSIKNDSKDPKQRSVKDMFVRQQSN